MECNIKWADLRDRLKESVTTIEISFYGSGDNGAINEIDCYLGESSVTILNKEESEMLEEWAYEALSEHYGGWEIDDGSSGTIRIELATGKANIEIEQFYTGSSFDSSEFNVVDSAEEAD